jgi:hypothetical protein
MFCAHLLKTTLKELSKRLRAWDTPSVITSKPANEIVARDLVVLCFQNAPFQAMLTAEYLLCKRSTRPKMSVRLTNRDWEAAAFSPPRSAVGRMLNRP